MKLIVLGTVLVLVGCFMMTQNTHSHFGPILVAAAFATWLLAMFG